MHDKQYLYNNHNTPQTITGAGKNTIRICTVLGALSSILLSSGQVLRLHSCSYAIKKPSIIHYTMGIGLVVGTKTEHKYYLNQDKTLLKNCDQ